MILLNLFIIKNSDTNGWRDIKNITTKTNNFLGTVIFILDWFNKGEEFLELIQDHIPEIVICIFVWSSV